MGLDIYFYKVKAQGANLMTRNENIEELSKMRNEIRIAKAISAELRTLISDLVSKNEKDKVADLVRPYAKYDFLINAVTTSTTTDELQKAVNEIFEWYTCGEDMYYRKVNFLYAYFADRLTREECIVTREDVEDIISKAERVLDERNAETSMELLPTQSGFFFGSTEYDNWYYSDVEDVLEKFTHYLADWDEDTMGWVYFSW